MFQLDDLNAQTRSLMLQELEQDLREGTSFYDARLREDGCELYFRLFVEALESGTPESFSEAIRSQGLLNETETRTVNGRSVEAKVSSIAHANIGEGEFNRYFMRAVCLQAIEQGLEEVEVYRAKQVTNPRPAGKERKNPKELLEYLRTTNISVAGSFPGPNSGRSVRLPH